MSAHHAPSPLDRGSILHRLRIAIGIFVLCVLCGVLGFMAILDVGAIDALYFTVVTLATVGYGDLHPDTEFGRAFTTCFILVGLATASYSLTILVQAAIEGELQDALGTQRMQRHIDHLKEHVVLCGFGRIGADLAAGFHAEGVPFVVLDQDEETIHRGLALGYAMLRGDATSDDALRLAGIDRARAIVPALASDVDNLFITLSARQLNPRLVIVARAQEESTATKMKKAGADRIIRPLHIGAQHMAQAVLRPAVLDFVQLEARAHEREFMIEEVPVPPGSLLAGRTLLESDIRRRAGVILIGIKRASGDLIFNPSASTPIQEGDVLVAMGDVSLMNALRRVAGESGPEGAEGSSSGERES